MHHQDRLILFFQFEFNCLGIPVFFGPVQRDLYDWLWKDFGWEFLPSVTINRQEFLHAEDPLWLYKKLDSIPQSEVDELHNRIKSHISEFQWSLDDSVNDLMIRLLQYLKKVVS